MRLEAPFWWYRERGALASALAPLGRLYGKLAEARSARVMPYRSRLPVICIGNFTAGGGGKTPTALAVAALLGELGARACFLTRGYGGTSEGPVLVRKGHSAGEVGDEPLQLQHLGTRADHIVFRLQLFEKLVVDALQPLHIRCVFPCHRSHSGDRADALQMVLIEAPPGI